MKSSNYSTVTEQLVTRTWREEVKRGGGGGFKGFMDDNQNCMMFIIAMEYVGIRRMDMKTLLFKLHRPL